MRTTVDFNVSFYSEPTFLMDLLPKIVEKNFP